MNRFLAIAFFVTLAVLAVFMVKQLFYHGIVQLNHPSREEYPIVGIDISHHNRRINWEELREAKLSFVVIKATEGATYRDSLFMHNYTTSKAEGYKTGAYLFYRFCKSPEEQAANFIHFVPKDSTDMPPVIDLEFGGNCETDLSKDELTNQIARCMQLLEEHYGKRPIIYVTQNFYDEYLTTRLTDYPLWIRNIYDYPEVKPGREWIIWQYANRARVRGVYKFVDLNVAKDLSVEALN
jgi:lysozyme